MDMKIKAFFLMMFLSLPFASFAGSSTCPLASGINVNTSKRVLNICEHGSVVKTFKVALGFKGVGKKRAGDNKTPVGLYGLAYPRKSNKYDVFIPILYPTSRQRAAGYSGRDVGIHGPAQSASALGWFGNLPFSTRGCIAVGKNNYIEYVAKWVKANPGAKVLIV